MAFVRGIAAATFLVALLAASSLAATVEVDLQPCILASSTIVSRTFSVYGRRRLMWVSRRLDT